MSLIYWIELIALVINAFMAGEYYASSAHTTGKHERLICAAFLILFAVQAYGLAHLIYGVIKLVEKLKKRTKDQA